VNNINDKLDATITILLIFESTCFGQSFAHLRKIVVYSNVVYCPNVVVGWRSGVRRRGLCVQCERYNSSNMPHTEHIAQCFSTAGPRPGTGPWHQLYRAARGL